MRSEHHAEHEMLVLCRWELTSASTAAAPTQVKHPYRRTLAGVQLGTAWRCYCRGVRLVESLLESFLNQFT